MARKRVARRRTSSGFQSFDPVGDRHPHSSSNEARRFLKHLDRRLQKFSSNIDSLEERANRLADMDDPDLILAVESLHRETLLLRAEIREHLAQGNRNHTEMTEYAEESWEQLKDTFEELKQNLDPEDLPTRSVTSRSDSEDPEERDTDSDLREDEDEWGWDEDDWTSDDEVWSRSEIHRPKVGPKR